MKKLFLLGLMVVMLQSNAWGTPVEKFVENILREKNGYEYGEIIEPESNDIFMAIPIYRTNGRRSYITSIETEKLEVKDSGNINKAIVYNNSRKTVFIRAGSILHGKTQQRTTTISVIMDSKSEMDLSIACIHASKGIQKGSSMKFNDFVPDSFVVASHMGGQNAVWRNISNYSRVISADATAMGTTDDWVKHKENYDSFVKKVLPQIEYEEEQVGLIFLDAEGVYGIEIFDHTKSWEVLMESIIKCKGGKLIKESEYDAPHYTDTLARQAIKGCLTEKFNEEILAENDIYATYLLTNEAYIGEATVFKNKVIHFNLIRKE